MKTIVICSSASFYQHAVKVQAALKIVGYTAVIPKTARIMHERNDFDVSHYKTWYGNADDYDKKAALMRAHFDEIAKGDAILVLNDTKHGQTNYIGPNVLMEMSLAFYLHKPIYIFNDLPEDSPFEEELKGFAPIILRGNLDAIN